MDKNEHGYIELVHVNDHDFCKHCEEKVTTRKMYTPHSEKTISYVRKEHHKEVAKQVLRHTEKYGKKVMVNDKIFLSIGKAAAYVGVCRSNLRKNLEKGNNKINGYDVSYVKEVTVKGEKAPIKVLVDGRVFHSISIAAGFMNISSGCLSSKLQQGITLYQGYEIGYAGGN